MELRCEKFEDGGLKSVFFSCQSARPIDFIDKVNEFLVLKCLNCSGSEKIRIAFEIQSSVIVFIGRNESKFYFLFQ